MIKTMLLVPNLQCWLKAAQLAARKLDELTTSGRLSLHQIATRRANIIRIETAAGNASVSCERMQRDSAEATPKGYAPGT